MHSHFVKLCADLESVAIVSAAPALTLGLVRRFEKRRLAEWVIEVVGGHLHRERQRRLVCREHACAEDADGLRADQLLQYSEAICRREGDLLPRAAGSPFLLNEQPRGPAKGRPCPDRDALAMPQRDERKAKSL